LGNLKEVDNYLVAPPKFRPLASEKWVQETPDGA
jgi:hypothetical protein